MRTRSPTGRAQGPGRKTLQGWGLGPRPPSVSRPQSWVKYIYIFVLQYTVLLPTHIFVRSSAGTLHFPIYKNLQNSKIRISLRERKDRGRHTEGHQGRT